MDWKLNPVIFQRIDQLLGRIEVDLLVSRITRQCPTYYSWRPNPFASAADAFLQDWSHQKGFANPPWGLIGRVLSQVQAQQAHAGDIAGPGVENPAMVPTTLGDAIRLPAVYRDNPSRSVDLFQLDLQARSR